MVEWAHRIGPQQIIDHHLDQSLSATLFMQTNNLFYSNTGNNAFFVEGQNVLLFVDYSAEVSHKHKAFFQVCSTLFKTRSNLLLLILPPYTLQQQKVNV